MKRMQRPSEYAERQKKFGSLRKNDYLANQKYPRRSLRFLPVNDLCGGYAGQGSGGGSGEGGVEIDLNN
ncbi:hypothetical protein [uncultured Alistipes sp.]|uniref:hypothetical protein n=1 Tax=uncultured Alistipes sp. TaxID=538949 RepID=UPI002630D082|nr:hypothetical protein [uncultured Alistipes sp.]